MEDIVIWGTGLLGSMAYLYYKDRGNIKYFVDSDEKKWGSRFYQYDILNPDKLKEYKGIVVIALRNGKEEIKSRLSKLYSINRYVVFDVVTDLIEEDKKVFVTHDLSKTIIVCFSGGLGNQMFQYAFYKAQKCFHKHMIADISSYKETTAMPFCIDKVFNQIEINKMRCKKDEIIKSIVELNNPKKYLVYKEPTIKEANIKEYDPGLLDVSGGLFDGYFQTYRFAELVEEQLRDEFRFSIETDAQLCEISKVIKDDTYVSVHIRRGDYLLKKNKEYYYNEICNIDYYIKAIEYIRDRIGKCKLCFFSDDIEWVKKELQYDDSIYIEEKLFDKYEDWFDMLLMSLCKHNIIANSTFSWWGAWLNNNPHKIVIAPKSWINGCEYNNLCPETWIKI